MNTGITEKNRTAEALALNSLLARELSLAAKTKKFHWNVTGPNFGDLHRFFDEQYSTLQTYSDDTAERIRALGKFAIGEPSEIVELNPQNISSKVLNASEMLQELLHAHEAIIRELRLLAVDAQEKYTDIGTADFLTGLLEGHEKMAWMTRSYLN